MGSVTCVSARLLVYPPVCQISFTQETVPLTSISPLRAVPSQGTVLLCLPPLIDQTSESLGLLDGTILAYPVISTFFHSSDPGSLLTSILTSPTYVSFSSLPFICHEPSNCLVIFDPGLNPGSSVGLFMLINHSLPPNLVGYISIIPNLSNLVIDSEDILTNGT